MELDLILDIASGVLIGAGVIASFIGAIGIIRLPDIYTRMHAAGIIDTFGVGTIMLGLMLQAGFTLVTIKLLLIVGFVFFTAPTTTHALARAAIHGHVKPKAEGRMPEAEEGFESVANAAFASTPESSKTDADK